MCLSDPRADASSIWQAGVDAVRAERLVGDAVRCSSDALTICGRAFPLAKIGRIAVVGAGKAGAGMAAAIESILGREIVERLLVGWVNVPADCVRPLRRIRLHAARPAGINEPTAEGVEGALAILDIVSRLQADDLCLVLLSGGGSALLPAPIPEISLADKLAVTKFLMRSGATIGELNTVRKHLSRIKGGGLSRAIRAGVTRTLIISDVVGDPLDVIASGPTVPDTSTAAQALEVLRRFSARPPAVPQAVFDALASASRSPQPPQPVVTELENHVIGNNAVAMAAAAARAAELGYAVRSFGSDNVGEADVAGRDLAERCLALRDEVRRTGQAVCLLSGGEPIVRLSPHAGKGGRNQQLVLAAVQRLWNETADGWTILSGGTDGEDGPTDAAGAIADLALIEQARVQKLDPGDFLHRNDAYRFFDPLAALIRTGPTHTNVMDLRVAIVR